MGFKKFVTRSRNDYRSQTVLRCRRIARRTFIQKARAKYSTMGEPKVKKEAYTKDSRTLLEEKPNRLPKALQTPKLCFSIKSVSRFISAEVEAASVG